MNVLRHALAVNIFPGSLRSSIIIEFLSQRNRIATHTYPLASQGRNSSPYTVK